MARNPFSRGGVQDAPEFTLRASPAIAAPPGAPDLPSADTKAFASLSDQIDKLTAEATRATQHEAQTNAFEAGLVAGNETPGAQMTDGGRVYRDSYNRAATEAGLRRLEITTRENLGRLAKEHETDPVAFGQAAEAYRNGAAADLPAGLSARFQLQFDALTRPIVNALDEKKQALVRDQDLAGLHEAMPLRAVARDQAAQALATDPAAAADLRREDENFRADLIGRGPRQAFTLDGREYPADPTRTGSLRIDEMQKLLTSWRRGGDLATALGAMRASPNPAQFIDDFERGMGFRRDGAAAPGAMPGPAAARMAARVPEAWVPIIDSAAAAQNLPAPLFRALIGLESGGNAGAVSSAGARGPAQITPSTAAKPGYGMQPLPEDALHDPARAIPWAAEYLAKLRDAFGGDLRKAVAAYNTGEGNVRRAGGDESKLARETQNYLAVLLDGSGGSGGSGAPAVPGGLPLDEVAHISRVLRSELAHQEQARRQAQHAERLRLDPLITQNLVAARTGQVPPNDLTDDDYFRAGYEGLGKRQEVASAQRMFVAATDLKNATSLERVQQVADAFSIGTPNFMTDPKAAQQVLEWAAARGAQIRHGPLNERVADMVAEAESKGVTQAITVEEGVAAGMTPEAVAKTNADIARKAETFNRFQARLRMTSAEAAAAEAELPIEGPDAAENRLRLQAYAKAAEAQRSALQTDSAGFIVSISRPAQELMAVAGQDPQAMKSLLSLIADEQTRLGVPAGNRRPLPDGLINRVVSEISGAPSDLERLRKLNNFLSPVEDPAQRAAVMGQLVGAGMKKELVVGAAIAQRAGEALGARIAGELGADPAKLGVEAADRTAVRRNVVGVWDNDDRLGGLYRAQYAATGANSFRENGEGHQQRFEKVALVRQGGTGTYDPKEIYTQMFGGQVVVNQPRAGVLVSAPDGTDADKLAAGLMLLRTQRVSQIPGNDLQRRAWERQGVWVDHETGQFALYARDLGAPMTGADGKPIVASVADALAAQASAGRSQIELFRAARQQQFRDGMRRLGTYQQWRDAAEP